MTICLDADHASLMREESIHPFQRQTRLQEAPIGGLIEARVCPVEISCLNMVDDRLPSVSETTTRTCEAIEEGQNYQLRCLSFRHDLAFLQRDSEYFSPCRRKSV